MSENGLRLFYSLNGYYEIFQQSVVAKWWENPRSAALISMHENVKKLFHDRHFSFGCNEFIQNRTPHYT